MSPTKDIRVEVKVRNNLLLSAMEKKGIPSIKELCRQMGTPSQYVQVMDLAGMRTPALQKGGDWKPIVKELADFFDCMPEDLFSEMQQSVKLKKNRAHVAISHSELQQLMGRKVNSATPDLTFQAGELRQAVSKVLSTLTPREERVLRMRFGFGPDGEMSLDQIGAKLNMHRSRVGQIEAKALRKIKHPSRIREIQAAVGGSNERGTPILDEELFEAL